MKGLGKWNPLSKPLEKAIHNPWTRNTISATVYSSITGSVIGLEYDLFNGIAYGNWDSFGQRALSGLKGGAASGATLSGVYNMISRFNPKEKYIPELEKLSNATSVGVGQYIENESMGINATYVVCDTNYNMTFVYTYVPYPIYGAVPIQNMYIYDNFEGLLKILLRLKL